MPDPAKYVMAAQPKPPAPMTNTDPFNNRFCAEFFN